MMRRDHCHTISKTVGEDNRRAVCGDLAREKDLRIGARQGFVSRGGHRNTGASAQPCVRR